MVESRTKKTEDRSVPLVNAEIAAPCLFPRPLYGGWTERKGRVSGTGTRPGSDRAAEGSQSKQSQKGDPIGREGESGTGQEQSQGPGQIPRRGPGTFGHRPLTSNPCLGDLSRKENKAVTRPPPNPLPRLGSALSYCVNNISLCLAS